MARIYGSTSSSQWGVFVDIWEESYNINNNSSYVIAEAYLYRTNSASYYGGTATVSITVDGSTQSTTSYPSYPTNIGAGVGNAQRFARFGYTVYHNSDGSKSASMSMSWSADFIPNSGSASGSLILTTIPRASTITATSVYAGETSQITVTRKNNSFTHSIYFTFGELSGYILADGTTTSTQTKITETSIGFPIPKSWLEQISNSQDGNCSLTIKTYSGNTQIGNQQVTTFKVRVDTSPNSESRPTVTSSVKDINDSTFALTGNRNTLIKGYSNAEVTYSANANDYATLSSVTINGSTVTQSPYTFILKDNTIKVIATDSRGLDKVSEPAFTLKDYLAPNLTISSERVEPTSSYANIIFNGSWFNDTFGSVQNTLTIKWKYKKTGSNTWVDGGTLVNGTDYTINGNNIWSGTGSVAEEIEIGGSLDYNYAWDIGLFINDKLVTLPEIITTITKGIPIVNWEEDFFNVNGDIRQNNISIFNRFVYSTEETICGVWLNKPLYRKVLDIGRYTWSYGDNTFNHYISNMDALINLEYVMQYTNGRWYKSWDYINTKNWTAGAVNVIIGNADTSTVGTTFNKFYLILEYTKTTD